MMKRILILVLAVGFCLIFVSEQTNAKKKVQNKQTDTIEILKDELSMCEYDYLQLRKDFEQLAWETDSTILAKNKLIKELLKKLNGKN